MNKTIIRVTKKLLGQNLGSESKNKTDLGTSASEAEIFDYLVRFLFKDSINNLGEYDLSFSNLCDYLYLIVGSNKHRRRIQSSIRHHFVKVKTTINRYSHKRMMKLLDDKYFKFIFKSLLHSGQIQKMLVEDQTTGKNAEKYVFAAEEYYSAK